MSSNIFPFHPLRFPHLPMPSHSLKQTGAELREQVLHECVAMIRFALASGMTVPPTIADIVEKARFTPADQPMEMAPVIKVHSQLARMIAPATPRALLVMGDEHSTSKLAWFGSVGLVRRMMAAAVISVVVFMVLGMSDYITSKRLSPETADGLPLLVNELFWMSAAAIGASFAMLMQVNDFIVKRTYDPKYEPSYWIKFVLGVMAGFIMAVMLPVAKVSPDGSEIVSALELPTLAMLGGFSASAVYRILVKIVESLESVFRGNAREQVAERERAAQSRANEDISQSRLSMASQIVKLQQQMATGTHPGLVSQALDGMLRTLVPGSPEDPPAPGAVGSTVSLPNVPIVAAPDAATMADEPATTPAVSDESGGDSGDGQPVAATATTTGDDGQPAAAG